MSALAEFSAGLDSGTWHLNTRRRSVGVRRGRSVAGTEESWRQRTLSSGGRDIFGELFARGRFMCPLQSESKNFLFWTSNSP